MSLITTKLLNKIQQKVVDMSGGMNDLKTEQGKLKAKAPNDSWVDVVADEEGRLKLATEIQVDATGMSVEVPANVGVYNKDNEPLAVQLSGAIIELARSTSNTTISAGATWEMYTSSEDSLDYTKIALTRWLPNDVPKDCSIRMTYNLPTFTGKDLYVELSKQQNSVDIVELASGHFTLSFVNEGTSDRIMNRFRLCGVR